MKLYKTVRTRKYWFWVTRPEYYLDENGEEHAELDPNTPFDPDIWWTCHERTQAGDLILLYRTSPKSDIRYLIRAESDAHPIADDHYALEQGWSYGCSYRVLYRFENPLTFREIGLNPYLRELPAYKRRFQGTNFEISEDDWARLHRAIAGKNEGFDDFASKIEWLSIPERREVEIENALASNLQLMGKLGYDLELFQDPVTTKSGKQYFCQVGVIDLLCVDRNTGEFAVIEIKRGRADRNAFGQVCSYVGWVQSVLASGRSVVGLVLSSSYDEKFHYCLKLNLNIRHYELSELGLA